MNTEIDARGMDCPKPVIITKKTLDGLEEGSMTTIVDNEVAKENVSKLVSSMGYSFSVEEKEGDFYININKDGLAPVLEVGEDKDLKDMTIGIASDTMGSGDDLLGKILMKSFIYTVSETRPFPSRTLRKKKESGSLK